jgi:hypothetical protein
MSFKKSILISFILTLIFSSFILSSKFLHSYGPEWYSGEFKNTSLSPTPADNSISIAGYINGRGKKKKGQDTFKALPTFFNY